MATKVPENLKKLLEKQQYEFIGDNSAVKICEWAKKSLRDEGFCYKQKFYGIKSHLCCQMSTTVGICTNKCVFCWREIDYTIDVDLEEDDNPEKIIDKALKAQRKLLSGFGGNKKTNLKKFKEAQKPMHFAISLTGEPTCYKQLPKLLELLHKKEFTTFVVSNGQYPDRLKNLKPTQLYVSIDAPNKELFKKICNPFYPDAWKRLLESLKTLKNLNKKTRTCLRITLIKGLNMVDEKGYAELIKIAKPKFIEVKAYMFVGSSTQRLEIKNMPRHNEIMEFAKKIAKLSKYKIVDEKKESRVVLLMKKDSGRNIIQ